MLAAWFGPPRTHHAITPWACTATGQREYTVILARGDNPGDCFRYHEALIHCRYDETPRGAKTNLAARARLLLRPAARFIA